MIGNEINTLRSKNRPFDDPCRDNKDSELDSFFCVCVCVFCVCFVSSLGFFFFLYLSRDKNTRESERCVCGKKKVRARSVFPSSDDDERFENAEIVPKASSERSWKTKIAN